MNSTYIYVLVNPSFRDDLIKIGLTRTKTPEERAKKLTSTTGVPNEFVVAYKKHVFDSDRMEKLVHKYLEPFRSNQRREFFVIPVERAINIIERFTKLENSLEAWNGQVVNFDGKQLKWHMQADDIIAFFRYESLLPSEIKVVDYWHAKDDGDEVYFTGGHILESDSLPSNGFLSDEMRLNPGDYVIWCGKDRNSVNLDERSINHCILKVTDHSYVSGFCAMPRSTHEGFPIRFSGQGSGMDPVFLKFAYEQAKQLGIPRVWAETYSSSSV